MELNKNSNGWEMADIAIQFLADQKLVFKPWVKKMKQTILEQRSRRILSRQGLTRLSKEIRKYSKNP